MLVLRTNRMVTMDTMIGNFLFVIQVVIHSLFRKIYLFDCLQLYHDVVNHFISFSYDEDSFGAPQTQNEREFQQQICTRSPEREEVVEDENQAINELYSIEL